MRDSEINGNEQILKTHVRPALLTKQKSRGGDGPNSHLPVPVAGIADTASLRLQTTQTTPPYQAWPPISLCCLCRPIHMNGTLRACVGDWLVVGGSSAACTYACGVFLAVGQRCWTRQEAKWLAIPLAFSIRASINFCLPASHSVWAGPICLYTCPSVWSRQVPAHPLNSIQFSSAQFDSPVTPFASPPPRLSRPLKRLCSSFLFCDICMKKQASKQNELVGLRLRVITRVKKKSSVPFLSVYWNANKGGFLLWTPGDIERQRGKTQPKHVRLLFA